MHSVTLFLQLNRYLLEISNKSGGLIDELDGLINVLGWTGIEQRQRSSPYAIIECMRRWPESKEGKSYYPLVWGACALNFFSSYSISFDWIGYLVKCRMTRSSSRVMRLPGDIWERLASSFGKQLQINADSQSIADWGCPYISDILLRKSMADLQLFISRGMEPAEKNYRLLTPLHLAAAANWPDAVALLIASGADRCALDSDQLLPIDFAILTKCSEAVELLSDGDCTPYLIMPRQSQIVTCPIFMFRAFCSGNKTIRHAVLRPLIRVRNSLGTLRPYHDLAFWPGCEQSKVTMAERMFSEGLQDLELEDQYGETPLMGACSYNSFKLVKFLMDKGANPLKPHKYLGLTAGYFLASRSRSYIQQSNLSPADADLKLCADLLQTAFDRTDSIKSYCLCSPDGFTPLTALKRSSVKDKRHGFQTMMISLQWPTSAVERQARAFAIGEIFDRLEMTHTCVNMNNPSEQISEEDRLEIQYEEEEFNDQLRELMEEYDIERPKFNGSPLAFLDWFFEMHEMDLPSQEEAYGERWKNNNKNDKDLLGPGPEYQDCRYSFTNRYIWYGHREEVNDESMLALLFGKN
jgi:ankyrin repeat protein